MLAERIIAIHFHIALFAFLIPLFQPGLPLQWQRRPSWPQLRIVILKIGRAQYASTDCISMLRRHFFQARYR
ncbi:hypothetical protein BDV59DRAFT_175793 [Aspergillus ambiguus]|uniref:uncharacterized protein n=1 Tax=Aspergillus ambiguus TaxID=176160 RepID=UPI003CCD3375